MTTVEYQPAGQGRVLIRVSSDNRIAYPFRDSDMGVVRFFSTSEINNLFPGAQFVNIQETPEAHNDPVSDEEVNAFLSTTAPQKATTPAALPQKALPKVEEALTGRLIRTVGARGKAKKEEMIKLAAIVEFLNDTGLYNQEQYKALIERYGLSL